MTRYASVTVILAALLLGGYYLYVRGVGRLSANLTAYQNSTYGISFKYPDTYALQAREVGNGERYHYSIVLIDKVALANLPQAGEGPPTITIDIFQNNLDNLFVEEWIRNTSDSNFKISLDGILTPTRVGGADAVTYFWDGLYRGQSVVLAHKGNILMLTVTYNASSDQIRADFSQMLSSVALY